MALARGDADQHAHDRTGGTDWFSDCVAVILRYEAGVAATGSQFSPPSKPVVFLDPVLSGKHLDRPPNHSWEVERSV